MALCHDASSGLGGPVERVCRDVPFRHEGHQALCQLIAVSEVADREPFALEKTEPLLDLVHPGALHGHTVAHKTRMGCQPSLNLLAFMDAGVIQHAENAPHLCWDLPIESGKQQDEFVLAFAPRCESRDLARAPIKGSKQVHSSCTLVFMLHAHWESW